MKTSKGNAALSRDVGCIYRYGELDIPAVLICKMPRALARLTSALRIRPQRPDCEQGDSVTFLPLQAFSGDFRRSVASTTKDCLNDSSSLESTTPTAAMKASADLGLSFLVRGRLFGKWMLHRWVLGHLNM